MTFKTGGKTRNHVRADHKKRPPKICTQQSITIPPDQGAKLAQVLPYKTPEWQAHYGMRSTIEGVNGSAKDTAYELLEAPGRRRVRGVAAQSLFVAFLIFAMNLRRIERFENVVTIGQGQPTRLRRRRKHPPLQAYGPANPATGPPAIA